MNESTFGVHKIKFMIKSSPGLGNCGGIWEHADGSLNLSQITSWNNSRGLIVDSDLKRILKHLELAFRKLTLKPVGHQSTNWIVRLVLILAIEALTSLGTTSPRYNRQQAMYLPKISTLVISWKHVQGKNNYRQQLYRLFWLIAPFSHGTL